MNRTYPKYEVMNPFGYISVLMNKQVLLTATVFTPLIMMFQDISQDALYMIMVLLTLVFCDTVLGIYIAWKNGVLSSGKDGYGRIVDKLISYFGLILLTYSVIVIGYTVPLFKLSESVSVLKYLAVFSFSAMYGREILSIFESIDKLQPKLLPPALKKLIRKAFKKDIEIL